MKLSFPVAVLTVLLLLFHNIVAEDGEGRKPYANVPAPDSEDTIFAEIFDDSWDERWIISQHPDFNGEWIVSEGEAPHSVQGDQGLIVNSEARKHAISANFKRILDNNDKDELTIQYELRLQKNLDCGGAYIKLLTAATLPSDLSRFSNEVPYTIMFGPDKCGSTNKVHFIVRHKNPVSGLYEEKHLKDTPSMKSDTISHHYKLKIRKDNSFTIYIDDVSVKEGNLQVDFEPPFNPPKEIDDPEDKKPSDWVDEAKIPDNTAVKPDDWNEDAPATIIDENGVKPEGWLDDEPLTVPDPEVSKPEDWDDDLDGDWEPPLIPNPKCEEIGCGEWKPRHIPNPNYKGKWHQPLIDNPAYKGEWYPRKIPNPHYFVDEHPHNLEPMSAIGIELWTMKDGILFDNILITHNTNEAEEFTQATWVKKHADEQTFIDAEISSKTPSFGQQLRQAFEVVIDYVTNPDNLLVVVGAIVVVVVVPLVLCLILPTGRGREARPPADAPAAADASQDKTTSEKEKEKEKEKKKKKKVD